MKVTLDIVDGKAAPFSVETLKRALPSFKDFFYIIGVGIVSMVIVAGGLVLLIIPGLYFLVRLSYSNLSYVDRREGVLDANRHSWAITKGDAVWTIILVLIIFFGLLILGVIVFIIGLIITYPIGFILYTKLYRALTTHYEQTRIIVPQSEEITDPQKTDQMVVPDNTPSM